MPPSPLPNPFDHASRSLLRRAGVALLCWLLRMSLTQIRFVTWLDTRLNIPDQPERVCDTIAHVQRLDQGGYPWAIPFEFQVTPDSLMFGRALVYEGMLWMQHKPTEEVGDRFDMLPVIVNLTGIGRCARRMAWLPGAETTLGPIEWDLETLDAELLMDQMERGEAPLALLAFISLMKKGNEPGTIERWLRLAELERNPIRKADLALVVVFAQLTKCRDVWKKALEGFNVIESISVNEWKAEGVLKDLVGILEDKFATVPPDLLAKIQATTALDVLHRWVLIAARVDSLDKFRQTAGV